MITNGSQDALGRAFEMLINTGDDVLVEAGNHDHWLK
jgi:DNA-binding transcriptional MocR family regulator